MLAQGHKQTCGLISTLSFINAERQAEKLWIPTFTSAWSSSRASALSSVYQDSISLSSDSSHTKRLKKL